MTSLAVVAIGSAMISPPSAVTWKPRSSRIVPSSNCLMLTSVRRTVCLKAALMVLLRFIL